MGRHGPGVRSHIATNPKFNFMPFKFKYPRLYAGRIAEAGRLSLSSSVNKRQMVLVMTPNGSLSSLDDAIAYDRK